MLLTVPTEILIVIAVIILVIGAAVLLVLGSLQIKEREDIRREPEEIKKKADAPELPSEGQEDKPIDGIDA